MPLFLLITDLTINLPSNIYLALGIAASIFFSTNEMTNPSLIMERLFNYTSYASNSHMSPLTQSTSSMTDPHSTSHSESDLELIERLLDRTGSFAITNTICCGIIVMNKIIQYLVLGTLRVSERQHLRETFWDFFLQKSLFTLFILDAKSYEERAPWAIWFTILGSVSLLSRICRCRIQYLSSSPATKKLSLIKISILLILLLTVTLCCTGFALSTPFSKRTIFLLADSTFILTFVLSVITRLIVHIYDLRTNSVWENRASIIYYSDLLFSMAMLTIDLLHHSHLLIISNHSILIMSYCFIKIHTLVMDIRRRYRRHNNYLIVVHLMESNFPMASQEDIDKNSDDCAICWDRMDSARKLPCGHLFHNSCLRSWLEQDTSCPTCRTNLKGQQEELTAEVEDQSESEEEFIDTTRTHQRNPLFHFDSSRYTNNPILSWLPTISIEGFM